MQIPVVDLCDLHRAFGIASGRNEEVLPAVVFEDKMFKTILSGLFQNISGKLAQGEKIISNGPPLTDE